MKGQKMNTREQFTEDMKRAGLKDVEVNFLSDPFYHGPAVRCLCRDDQVRVIGATRVALQWLETGQPYVRIVHPT